MRSLAVLALSVAVLAPHAGWTATVCPDRTIPAIISPVADSVKCQATIAKAALGFAKAKLKALGKCMAAQVPGVCPDAKTADKINKAAMKGAAKITTDCGTDSVQAGLASSYKNLTDDTVISSCMFSQHNVSADILLGEINGTPGRVRNSTDRDKCVKTLNKVGIKQATSAHKAINKCIATQEKNGSLVNLVPVCVGHWAGGTFFPPSDANTATALSGLQTKSEAKIAKDCTINPILIQSVFACPGAASVADLQQCISCDTWDGVLDFVQQENSENGTFVANGPSALQNAVTAALAGDKLLIGSGTYQEQVTISTANLQLVGCGGGTGNRPNVARPSGAGPFGNGISAGGIDGLVFQSLDIFGWDDNGIFISNANGVTFRDVHADGNLNSTYGIFPVTSNNVTVEDSSSVRVRDAGIYIGQSTNIVSRYNRAEGNVAGMEIENSDTATVHNNYCADNSGGLLVFKLPNLPIQVSQNHQIFDNVSLHNNTPNFGLPGSTVSLVPTGTGMLIISNAGGQFRHNIVEDNKSLGIALVDQQAINALVPPPPPFSPTSPVQKATNNKIHDNLISGNGTAPESPVGGDLLMAIFDDSLPHGNCITGNSTAPGFVSGANDCP
ncbi:MAG TPA: parallel beta-helix domain-containing protein [Candidatus Binatia bacterium]|jgi:parallel beta-helix repeat protein